MKRTDILVEVRNRELERLGTITGKYLHIEAMLRFCNVGSWTLNLPGGHPMIDALSADGSGIIVSLHGEPLFSGPTTKPKRKRDRQNPDGTFTFVGVTDEILLADALAYPDPTSSDPTSQAAANDVRSGPIETLMHEYVDANIGPSAATTPIDRRRGLREKITLGLDEARGATVQKSPRFQNLLTLEQELSLLSDGALGFRMVQSGAAIEFQTFAVRDRTDVVRLDIENGTITSEEVEKTGPTITYAIVAGQGEGTSRTIVPRTTAAATAAETAWGRPIERFIDQRNTDVVSELEQSGDEALLEAGFTATAVKVIPSDSQTMLYVVDWREGDLITVVVNGQETQSTVTAAALIVNSKTVAVGAAIGNVTGFDKEAALTQRVDDVEKRVDNIERSEQPAPEWADLIGVPLEFPPAAHDHDDRYYTETEADAALSAGLNTRAPASHTHPVTDVSFLQALDGNVLPAVWPDGVSTSQWAVDGSWPCNYGTCLTVKSNSEHRVSQTVTEKATGDTWIRSGDSTSWGAWRKLAYMDNTGVPFAMAAGAYRSSSDVSSGGGVTIGITFPSGRFTVPPRVLVTVGTSARLQAAVLVDSTTTSGASVRLDNFSGGTATDRDFDWLAIQMYSNTSIG